MAYEDLNDHPQAAFARYESQSADFSPFEIWAAKVERLLGFSLDGDQSTDGYSIDYARDNFIQGKTPEEYAAVVRQNQKEA